MGQVEAPTPTSVRSSTLTRLFIIPERPCLPGIGLETARVLASAGADVVVAARSQATADGVASGLRAGGALGAVTPRQLELSDLSSIEAFAASLDSLPAIHVLVLNAGEHPCGAWGVPADHAAAR